MDLPSEDSLPPLKCEGCIACCIKDSVSLMPDEDPAQYRTTIIGGTHYLERNAEGNCVYLTPTGCSIHDRRPFVCRRYDCRIFAMRMSKLSASERAKRAHLEAPRIGRRKLAELGIILPGRS